LVRYFSLLEPTIETSHGGSGNQLKTLLRSAGNAKIDGLQEDLHMTDGQYNATLTIFFVSYALFEPLTNILLKKLRPSIFLPIIMVWWGICMTCMGLTHNFAGMMTAVRHRLLYTRTG
jgi:sugar phosphate permease